MDNGQNKINLEADDFDAIEQAVLETERGRWFLAEYTARNRRSETTTLLNSIARLEKSVATELYEKTHATNDAYIRLLGSELETLIKAIASPHNDVRDPIDALAYDVTANAFKLASIADKMRDQIDGINIVTLPTETILSLTQSINQIITLSARQSQLGRQVEALAKILSFCRERLARAGTLSEQDNQQDFGRALGDASLSDLRQKAYALIDVD
jgi:hypothetical protein